MCAKLDNIIIREGLHKGEMCGGRAGRGGKKNAYNFLVRKRK
jgi:hypothetical protein